MAEKIVALNLGSQNITLGLFHVDEESIELVKYVVDGIVADPANEAVRNTQLKSMLEKHVNELGLKASDVLYSIPGQSVFTRFVKLPALGNDNIDQLVEFEAQQHIPYPIDEVAWDWEMIDDEGTDKEVAIVAVKSSIIDQIDEVVSTSGLVPKSVESSQISIANSFYHAYPGVVEPVLIMDLGAKSTNLIFIQGTQVFIRSVSVSGIAITSAVAKEYKVDFDKAEEYKVKSGRVAINSAYLEEWDEQTGALAQSVTNALSRLPSEVTRTINYWRSQEGGDPPTKIYLAGAGANLPYLKEYIEERLKIETEYFNPLQNVFLSDSVDQQKILAAPHVLSELVGLAAKGAKVSSLNIDLVPSSISMRRAEERKRPVFATAAGVLCAGVLIWTGTQFIGNMRAKSALKGVTKEVAAVKEFDKEISELNKQLKRLDSTSEPISTVVKNKYRALSQMEELKEHLSSEVVWLSSVEDLVNYDFKDADEVDKFRLVQGNLKSPAYGKTMLEEKLLEVDPKSRNSQPMINAVLVKGFWRANPKNQQVVYDMIDSIKADENSLFSFDGKKGELGVNEILKVETVMPSDEFKASFTMILPLANPVEIVK